MYIRYIKCIYIYIREHFTKPKIRFDRFTIKHMMYIIW